MFFLNNIISVYGVYMSVFSRIYHKEKKHQYVRHDDESNRFFTLVFFSSFEINHPFRRRIYTITGCTFYLFEIFWLLHTEHTCLLVGYIQIKLMASLTPMNTHEAKILRSKADNPDTQQYVEDVTILWFDPYMDEAENQKDVETTKALLREINDYVLFFSKPDPCIEYIKSVAKEKIFIISSGFYAQEHLEKIHHLQQVDSVFIFCVFRAKYLPLKDKYAKIIDVFTEQKDLMDSLRSNIELITKQAAAFGLFDGKERSTKFLKRESASFLWFQLLTEVLKNIALSDIKNTGIEEMLEHCQGYYRGNRPELKLIEEFRKQYVSLKKKFFIFRK